MTEFTLEQVQKGLERVAPVKPTYAPGKPEDSYSLDDIEKVLNEKPDRQDVIENPPAAQLDIDQNNIFTAASQRTTPIMVNHRKNFVSDQVHQMDNGDIYYQDAEGKLIPTDHTKHVVLQDPEDSRYKVFNRTKETNESALAGMARLVTNANVTGAVGYKAVKSVAPRVLESAERIGATVPRAAATDNPAVHATARIVSKLPGGAGPLEQGAEKMAGSLDNAASRAAEIPVGGVAADVKSAGNAAVEGITETIRPKGALAQKVSDAYDNVDKLILPNKLAAPSKLDNTLAIANRIQHEYEATRKEGFDPALNEVFGAITHPDGVTYLGLKRLIHNVGEMIHTGKIPEGMDEGNLKSLYGALKDDMREFLRHPGSGKAPFDGAKRVQAWERANKIAAGAGQRRRELARILGVNVDKSDENVFKAIVRAAGNGAGADVELLNKARRAMGEDAWKEISSAVTAQMGRRVTQGGEHFNPLQWLKDYDNMSGKAKELIFGNNSAHRQAIEDIKTVAERFPAALDLSHRTSDIAHVVTGGALFHQPGKVMQVIGALNVFSRALAKPATAKSLAKWAKRREDYMMAPPQTRQYSRGGEKYYHAPDARRRQLVAATDELAQAVGRDADARKEFNEKLAAVGEKAVTAGVFVQHLVRWLHGGVEHGH